MHIDFSSIPQRPGVYFFLGSPHHGPHDRTRGRRGKILYIGKAANLRNRLRSYFTEGTTLSPQKRAMLEEATQVRVQTTDSSIEALVLEAQLIKKHRPRYNVTLRDDKKYFSVGITREACPRIFLTHQPKTSDVAADFIGPFTDGKSIRQTLKLLRRVFPYRTHKDAPRRCLQYDMGLCPIPPGIDPLSRAVIQHCRRNVRALRAVLTGRHATLIRRLETEMETAARREDFTTAAKRRDELRGLEHIFRHRGVLAEEQTHRLTEKDIPAPVRRLLTPNYKGRTSLVIERVEGYDIANLAGGKAATGSMVVFMNGEPDTSQYKQFRVKTVRGANDVAMLREVLNRRFAHGEWPLPDIILIDGGKPQLNAALTALRNQQQTSNNKQRVVGRKLSVVSQPLVIALAKKREELYLPGRKTPLRLRKDHPFLLLLMHVRDESHRFARRYHHKLRDYR